MGLRCPSREGRCLALPGSQCFFQRAPQAFVLCLQRFDSPFQCLNLSLQPRDLFYAIFFCHTDKLTASRTNATTFLKKRAQTLNNYKRL